MATVRPVNGYWQLNWSDETGRHRVSLGRTDILTKRDADEILKKKRLELSTGAHLLNLNLSRGVTFREYSAEYLHWHAHEYPHSHTRIRQITEQYLLPRFEFTALDAIQPKEIEQYKRERLQQARAETVIKELRTLKAILNHAVRHGAIRVNPIQHVAAPRNLDSKPHRFYETADLDQLYQACEKNEGAFTAGKNNSPIWRLYANTGMRRMEGLYLRWKNVGREGIKIISTGDERTKSGAWRDVPLSLGAQIALDQLRRGGEHVLPRINPDSLTRAFRADARRADLDGSLHTLRHTYISHLVRLGVPLRTVQIYAGHAGHTTTEHYAYLAPGITPAAVTALSI